MLKCIFDVDDVDDKRDPMPYLVRLKKKHPKFKATLFVIPGNCTKSFLRRLSKVEWLSLALHGEKHDSNYEMAKTSLKDGLKYLEKWEKTGFFDKGYKAPGWQISDGMYKACLQKGYWVCDQPYNNKRRPKELKVFLSDNPFYAHYHSWNCCGNGLPEMIDKISFWKETEFYFMKEVIK